MDDCCLFIQTMKALRWNIQQVNKVIFNNYTTLIHNLIDLGDEDPNTSNVLQWKLAKEYLFQWQNNRP
jgi:hypothetical protein